MPIVFQENFSGFTAAGFGANPTAGQLDSDLWRVTGFSDGTNPDWGFTGASGTDFGRGVIVNDPTTGGIYATRADTPTFGSGLLYQATGTEGENDGAIVLRVQNTTAGVLSSFQVDFDWIYRNTGDRSSSLVFEYSTNGATFTTVSGGEFTTLATQSGQTVLGDSNTGLSLTGVTVNSGDYLYLRWRHDFSTGGGNRDEVGIDNVVVTANEGGPPPPQAISITALSSVRDEGDAGFTDFTFTVTRAGGVGAATVDWSVTGVGGAGQASAADFKALTGTLAFADGETSKTVTVQVVGDTELEADEAFSVTLANPSAGHAVGVGSAAGQIRNDDEAPPPPGGVWINEFHYDNNSTDVGEFVEIGAPAGANLAGFTVVLYNGGNGQPYATYNLSGVVADQKDGFGFVTVNVPASTGIQNGAPDGIALVGPAGVGVVEFISYEGAMTAVGGPAAGMTSTDVGVIETGSSNGTSIARVGHGVDGIEFDWVLASDDTPGAVNTGQTFAAVTPRIHVSDVTVTEGDAGTKVMSFTVTRVGSPEAFSVDYATADGTATAGTDYAAVSGVLQFAAGERYKTVEVVVSGDTEVESNESLFLNLSNATGAAVIVDGQGRGVVGNDDVRAAKIFEIQGAGHSSELEGQQVITEGVVTATDATGFWIQDEAGDGDVRTSDAVFVFTGTTSTVQAGQKVSVTGVVEEYTGGNTNNLPVTEVVSANANVTVIGTGTVTATVIGAGGLHIPSANIEDDNYATFDPANDAIDFFESIEGMLVKIEDAQAVGSTYEGSTWVVSGADHMNSRGGVTITEADGAPEKIQIYADAGVNPGFTATYGMGQQLGDVTGVVNYFGGQYQVVPISVENTTAQPGAPRETTALAGDDTHLTIATYNVENLDPTDEAAKFAQLGTDIAQHLGSPDIVGLIEIQDADGRGSGPDLSGTATLQKLVDAIVAAGGPAYAFIEIAPTANGQNGGEGGGNIRQAFLYNTARVDYVDGSIRQLTDTDPTNGDAYNNSRKPLVAEFSFNGEEVTAVAVHDYARSGGEPSFGLHQPATISGDVRRIDQTTPIKAEVQRLLAENPEANIAVVGDFNGFYWETAQTQLEGAGGLTNLTRLLSEDERFSTVFEGASQQLDHIFASSSLLQGAQFDLVHMNSGQLARTSDHDPAIARLLVNTAPVASVDAYGASEDVKLVVGAAQGVLANDADVNSDALTAVLQQGPAHGTLTLAADGSFTYQAAANYNGADSFTYLAKDASGAASAVRTVALNVASVNDAPVAQADAAAVDENKSVVIDVLANDTDVDVGDGKTIASVSATQLGGHVSIVDGKLVYAADNDAFDALLPGMKVVDSFSYTVKDAAGATSTATVQVTVNGVANGAPVFGGNGNSVVTGTALDEALSGGNGNDTVSGLEGSDLMSGGNGNDRLLGGAGRDVIGGDNGNDTINGGAGDDLLTGGNGADRFVFSGDFGADTVSDFSNADVIELSRSQFAGYADVISHAKQTALGVVITLDETDTITLLGTRLSSLSSGDFVFV